MGWSDAETPVEEEVAEETTEEEGQSEEQDIESQDTEEEEDVPKEMTLKEYAISKGWREDFKGPGAKSPQAFVEYMFDKARSQQKKIEALSRDVRHIKTETERAAQARYEQAKAAFEQGRMMLEQKLEDAVGDADVAAAKAITAQMQDMKPPAEPEPEKEDVHDEKIGEWWESSDYKEDPEAAKIVSDMARDPKYSPDKVTEDLFIALAEAAVLKAMIAREGTQAKASPAKRSVPPKVEGAKSGAPSKLSVKLTPEEREVAKILVRSGQFKSIEEYAKYGVQKGILNVK